MFPILNVMVFKRKPQIKSNKDVIGFVSNLEHDVLGSYM